MNKLTERRYESRREVYADRINSGEARLALEMLPELIETATVLRDKATCGEDRMKFHQDLKNYADARRILGEAV